MKKDPSDFINKLNGIIKLKLKSSKNLNDLPKI